MDESLREWIDRRLSDRHPEWAGLETSNPHETQASTPGMLGGGCIQVVRWFRNEKNAAFVGQAELVKCLVRRNSLQLPRDG